MQFAVNFTPFVEPANVPLAEMQSVNNASNLFAMHLLCPLEAPMLRPSMRSNRQLRKQPDAPYAKHLPERMMVRMIPITRSSPP